MCDLQLFFPVPFFSFSQKAFSHSKSSHLVGVRFINVYFHRPWRALGVKTLPNGRSQDVLPFCPVKDL